MATPTLNVLLVQLPVPNNPRANIPLAAGYLKAYAAREGLLEQVAIDILPRSVVDNGGDAFIVDEIARRRPDVLGVSLYTWNGERTLALVARARVALPDMLVVAGGPEVQRDNPWVLQHPAVDVAVLGEGEQTFAALLRMLLAEPPRFGAFDLLRPCPLCTVTGIAHRHHGELVFTPSRAGLEDLAEVPSPYLLGYLPLEPGDMALVECSRWCPYRCSFCLYGRNMGTKLGKRLFPVERVLAEVAWAREHGAGAVHFVEANLNLLPYFRSLVGGLQELNGDRRLRLYAELRGEHLHADAVEGLVKAGLHAAEVGLQSANPAALAAVDRRTDLLKWAAGTRRLYEHGVEVFLDVILGLPADDEQGVLRTLDWIAAQGLGPYDIFTLQVLPGTAVREQAQRWALRYQERPPYYVLETEQLPYSTIRALRWELKERAGFDPREIEGMPALRGLEETAHRWSSDASADAILIPHTPVEVIGLDCGDAGDWGAAGQELARRVSSHVTVHVHRFDAAVVRALCWPIAEANPTILWDLVIHGPPPAPAELRRLRESWPHEIGYLDRVAVFARPDPSPDWSKATPRIALVVPAEVPLDPLAYEGIALVFWRLPDEPSAAELAAVVTRGGEGVVTAGPAEDALVRWAEEQDLLLWCAPAVPAA